MRSHRGLVWLLISSLPGWAGSASAQSISTDSTVRSKGGFVFPDGTLQTTTAFPGTSSGLFLFAAGSTFVPRATTTDYTYSGAGCMHRNSSGVSEFAYDVQLPQGAVVDFMRVYFFDNSSAQDVAVTLFRFHGDGSLTLLASVGSAGTPGFSSAGSSFFAHIVDNVAGALSVTAQLPGAGTDLRFCGIRIRYQAPSGLTALDPRLRIVEYPAPIALPIGEEFPEEFYPIFPVEQPELEP